MGFIHLGREVVRVECDIQHGRVLGTGLVGLHRERHKAVVLVQDVGFRVWSFGI